MAFSPGLAMGFAFLTTGVAFKIAAVPFHYWTPDAYQGSPTPVTGYLSVGPKVGRVRADPAAVRRGARAAKADWLPVVIVLAALTMTLGNLVALTQDNVKRMLAYSSIAHTGYMLVGPRGVRRRARRPGLQGLLFYGAAYSFMNLGAFAVIAALQKRAGRDVVARRRSPGSAGASRCSTFLMTLFLLSLTGIPPTAGFFAKALIIIAAVEAGGWVAFLAVLIVLNAAVAAFYYLRVDRLHVHARPGDRRAAAPPRPAAVERPGGRDRADDHPRARAAADPRDHRPGDEGDRRLVVPARSPGGPSAHTPVRTAVSTTGAPGSASR